MLSRTKFTLFLGIVCALLIFAASPALATGTKVDPSPDATTLTEGNSTIVTFQLDAPIIAGSPNPTVDLTFVVSDPSLVSVSPSTLQWAAVDWSQQRTLNVTATNNATYDGDATVTVTVNTDSASVYFDNYVASFTVDIADDESAPTTTAAPTTTTTDPGNISGAGLANTGGPLQIEVVTAFVLMGLGSVLYSKRLRQKLRSNR